MTKEEKAKYQKFATFCMREKQTVLFNGHKYRAERMCFGFDPNGHEYIVVELADLNGCDSLITLVSFFLPLKSPDFLLYYILWFAA